MMEHSRMVMLFVVLSFSISFAQSFDPQSGSGNTQNTNTVDCSDPSLASSPVCSSGTQNTGTAQGMNSLAPPLVPELRNPAGLSTDQNLPRTLPVNPSQRQRPSASPWPETEFEQMVADTTGHVLPLFAQSLFDQPPSTFAPFDSLQVPSDYIIGPGDELKIVIWGQVQAALRVVVDRSGQIYIPQVGQVSVTGVHYADLEQHLKQEISKVFRNFNLTANVGRLRTIQVLVVGEARYPGTYTISSLSTLVNAVFASGGPTPQGSLRHIQVRRDGAIITDFDFYDLLTKGDKSRDVRLAAGDVIYIPHVGPLVAISGSINTPAIYEVNSTSTLGGLIETAGDLSTLADTNKITVDRVVDHNARQTLEFPYDAQSRTLPLKDGDIVRIFSIISRFEDTVTLRGNVANPGRYPWKVGMRISDLIPNAQALLTRRYWLDRADMVNGRATEYPVIPRIRPCVPSNGQSANANSPNISGNGNPNTTTGENLPYGAGVPRDAEAAAGIAALNENYNSSASNTANSNPNNVNAVPCTPAEADALAQDSVKDDNAPNSSRQSTYPSSAGNLSPSRNVTQNLRNSAPAINWDYAVIQRVNPEDLTSKLLWLSPRKAILEHDEASNLELKPGDIVTIFSQRDINVPQNERTRYVVIEGEVVRPGVYELGIDETLRSVLERAGGLTSNAYIYGSELTRESAREQQQKSLDELANAMETQLSQVASSLATAGDAGQVGQLQAAEQGVIAKLRAARASGRVALPVNPSDKKLTDYPDIVMEDSDHLVIPHNTSTVSVVGNVYNPGSFIFDPRTPAGAYLQLAGKGKPQSDMHHAFVVRANGTVVAANNVNGLFTGTKFDRLRLYPGDEIVVPFKVPTGAFVRGLRDWTQITSQLALTGAALAVIQ
jgi:protein involved in polysaccharide export with SLBB domain